MSELMGLVDTLEAVIVDSKKLPFSDTLLVDEGEILRLLDKLRHAIKEGEGVARQVIDKTDLPYKPSSHDDVTPMTDEEKKAKDMMVGASTYADNTLAGLQLMVTKMYRNLVKLEKNLESGREVLDKQKKEHGIEKELLHET